MTTQKINRPRLYLFHILLFIYGDIACENYILRAYNSLAPSLEFLLFVGILLLQVVAAPIQAALSDLYCRKRSLIVSIVCSLLSLILLLLFNLKILYSIPVIIFLSFLKGSVGNTIPLSLAAIADTQDKNYRFSFGLSTLAYTLAYLMMIFSVLYLSDALANGIIVIFYIIVLFLCITCFKDIRDRDFHSSRNSQHTSLIKLVSHELSLVVHDLKKPFFQHAIFAFLLWEISVYCVLLLYVDFNKIDFRIISITMMVGYLFGIYLLKKFNDVSDSKMGKMGMFLGSLSLIPFYFHFLTQFFKLTTQSFPFLVLAGCYFFHSVGMAILPPTLFAMLAKGARQHEQGRIYGVMESVDTIAFLISSISVMIYNFANLKLIYIITLSFVTVVVSWVPFKKYLILKPKEIIQ
ncbi:MAG: MFS transporter [Chlamydiia bacterium]|nr:MFS transporter [Chlamydiia bacterium]